MARLSVCEVVAPSSWDNRPPSSGRGGQVSWSRREAGANCISCWVAKGTVTPDV